MSYKQVTPLPVATGGTGAATLGANGVLLGQGTSAITALAVAATGSTLMGNTAADPSFTGSPSFSGSVTAATGLANTTGVVAINSGTSAFGLSTDASNTTVSIATGAANKLVTIGSTSGASSLALKTGTADFSLASATGTIMNALDTGEITYPLQSAFLANVSAASVADVTGDGTAYTILFDTVVYDQNSDYTGGTGTFTAPVTGRYYFDACVYLSTPVAGGTAAQLSFVSSNRTYRGTTLPTRNAVAGFLGVNNNIAYLISSFVDMDAADTITVSINSSGGAKTDDIAGGATMATRFCGNLIC